MGRRAGPEVPTTDNGWFIDCRMLLDEVVFVICRKNWATKGAASSPSNISMRGFVVIVYFLFPSLSPKRA